MALPPELGIMGRELLAFAKQASLLHKDVARPVVPRDLKTGADVVVVLHGLFATAGVMRPMRRKLDRHPCVETASLTYPPGPGIEVLASRLGSLLETLPADVRIHLVGHSAGGIVVRYYAQHVAPPGRVVQTISMASPFAGVRPAGLARWFSPAATVVRDLAPQSAILRELRLQSTDSDIPHLSILAENDTVIGRPTSHALVGGDVVLVRACGHNAVLYHPEATAAVEARIVKAPRDDRAPVEDQAPVKG